LKFNDEKKRAIILYLLEKIEKKAENISKSVSDAFDINQNTVHTYINQLVKENIIKRIKRGEYELIETNYVFSFSRSKGELESDSAIYSELMKSRIQDLPKNVQTIWEYAFTEMVNNVIDHSETETAQIIITRNYLDTTVIIKDSGVGIFEKIKNHFKYDTLDDAICELFKGKLTTDEKNHSGEGIFFSSKIMDEFFIISSGKIFTNNKFDDSLTVDIDKVIKGTWVIMSLSNYTQREIKEVFDMYSSVDGGFLKTTIPLKNIFDTAPISRSQAKRVCNRVSGFKEVVLDFEGLDWMGQGFAHQIFVVFKNENPEVIITPVNMGEDVTKMYNHVLN